MNVVYEAILNELQITVPTIRDEDLIVSANGNTLKKRVDSQIGPVYQLFAPTATRGKRGVVTINVSVRENEANSSIGPFTKDFRIKKLGDPDVIFNNDPNKFSWNRSALNSQQIQHKFADQDIDINMIVISFKVSVNGRKPILINGNSIGQNQQARTQINNASAGQVIRITEVNSVSSTSSNFVRISKRPLSLRIQ